VLSAIFSLLGRAAQTSLSPLCAQLVNQYLNRNLAVTTLVGQEGLCGIPQMLD
jgi:hypothetical protein